MLTLALIRVALSHTGVVLPWDADDFDYATAPPDAWKVLDLHVSVLVGMAVFIGLYIRAVTTWRKRYRWSPTPVESWRAWCFGIGQLVLFVSLNGPLHHLSDFYLFSAHMVQHLLLNLVWAPLTVVAIPPWLAEAALRVRWFRRVSDSVSSLRVKFILYNGVLYFWHIPTMYDAALKYHNLHIVEHLGFMGTAIIAWVGLLCSAPSLPRPHRLAQLLYLFLMSLPMKLLGAIITLSTTVIYTGYLDAPRIAGITPIMDQGYGGLLMWLPGGLVIWASMIYVFAKWVQEEKARPPEWVEGSS